MVLNLPNTFASALTFVVSNGYSLIFLIMVFEGPIITTAASFAAEMGYLNIFIILGLALLGDMTGDILFYSLGRYGGNSFVRKYGKYIGIKKSTILLLEKGLKKHFVKTFAFVKFAPLIPPAGLMAMGILKTPPKKFIIYSFIITLPRSIFFTALGYFSAMASVNVTHYLKLAEYVPFILIGLIIAAYYIFEKFFEKYSRKHNLLRELSRNGRKIEKKIEKNL
jgi:membrane protein DedA with SNARE-associated domain